MISGLTGTGTGTEIINLPGPGPGPGPIISILPGPGPGPTIQFDRDDRDDRDDGIWPGWPGPKPVFSYWKLHNLLLRLRGCLKMKFTMNESKNLKSQWMKLCKRSRSKSRQIWVIDRDRDRDQESWINRDRDRDRDEKCDLTGTGTGTGIAQNCQSQYRDSRYRESRSITVGNPPSADYVICERPLICNPSPHPPPTFLVWPFKQSRLLVKCNSGYNWKQSRPKDPWPGKVGFFKRPMSKLIIWPRNY